LLLKQFRSNWSEGKYFFNRTHASNRMILIYRERERRREREEEKEERERKSRDKLIQNKRKKNRSLKRC
jgi:hypothetical protein